MFGSDLLAAPILESNADSRKVYVPSKTIWRDIWTEQIYPGGLWLIAEAFFERTPLFLRGKASLRIKMLAENRDVRLSH